MRSRSSKRVSFSKERNSQKVFIKNQCVQNINSDLEFVFNIDSLPTENQQMSNENRNSQPIHKSENEVDSYNQFAQDSYQSILRKYGQKQKNCSNYVNIQNYNEQIEAQKNSSNNKEDDNFKFQNLNLALIDSKRQSINNQNNVNTQNNEDDFRFKDINLAMIDSRRQSISNQKTNNKQNDDDEFKFNNLNLTIQDSKRQSVSSLNMDNNENDFQFQNLNFQISNNKRQSFPDRVSQNTNNNETQQIQNRNQAPSRSSVSSFTANDLSFLVQESQQQQPFRNFYLYQLDQQDVNQNQQSQQLQQPVIQQKQTVQQSVRQNQSQKNDDSDDENWNFLNNFVQNNDFVQRGLEKKYGRFQNLKDSISKKKSSNKKMNDNDDGKVIQIEVPDQNTEQQCINSEQDISEQQFRSQEKQTYQRKLLNRPSMLSKDLNNIQEVNSSVEQTASNPRKHVSHSEQKVIEPIKLQSQLKSHSYDKQNIVNNLNQVKYQSLQLQSQQQSDQKSILFGDSNMKNNIFSKDYQGDVSQLSKDMGNIKLNNNNQQKKKEDSSDQVISFLKNYFYQKKLEQKRQMIQKILKKQELLEEKKRRTQQLKDQIADRYEKLNYLRTQQQELFQDHQELNYIIGPQQQEYIQRVNRQQNMNTFFKRYLHFNLCKRMTDGNDQILLFMFYDEYQLKVVLSQNGDNFMINYPKTVFYRISCFSDPCKCSLNGNNPLNNHSTLTEICLKYQKYVNNGILMKSVRIIVNPIQHMLGRLFWLRQEVEQQLMSRPLKITINDQYLVIQMECLFNDKVNFQIGYNMFEDTIETQISTQSRNQSTVEMVHFLQAQYNKMANTISYMRIDTALKIVHQLEVK